MPPLYGQPYKHELRAEIGDLNRQLHDNYKEMRKTKDDLIYANAEVRELEARLDSISQHAKAILDLATQPVEISFFEEKQRLLKRRLEEIRTASGALG
jgi:chromosome segregation ATPase